MENHKITTIRKGTTLNSKLSDISPIYFGSCTTGEYAEIGRRCNNFFIITYILDGSGTFHIDGKEHHVKKGDLIIRPQLIYCILRASRDDIIETVSVAFEGSLAADFGALPHVFQYPSDIFEELNNAHEYDGVKDAYVASLLLKLYSQLFADKKSDSKNYISDAKDYIKSNYMLDISVEEVAAHVKLNSSYLSRLFKKNCGVSVKKYIISTRLKEAKRLLNNGKNVTETAQLCGFNSQPHLTQAFKEYYGCTPKAQINVKSEDNKHLFSRD